MDGAGAGGAARERRKQLTAAEAVNHKRQLAQMVDIFSTCCHDFTTSPRS